jgi:mycothiol system anti-sigma-R factor
MNDDHDPAGSDADPPTEPSAAAGTADRTVGCTPSLAELFRYMDGFLDDGRHAELRSHLDRCGPCDDLYHFQARFRRMIGMRCQVELPPDLADRIFGAITGGDGNPGRPTDPTR